MQHDARLGIRRNREPAVEVQREIPVLVLAQAVVEVDLEQRRASAYERRRAQSAASREQVLERIAVQRRAALEAPAAAIVEIEGAEYERWLRRGLEDGEPSLEVVAEPFVVRVEKCDELGTRGEETDVASRGATSVGRPVAADGSAAPVPRVPKLLRRSRRSSRRRRR